MASLTRPKNEVILDAALHLFVDRGFHGTAVPDIARRARVAAGTIYHYFVSKDAMANTLYRTWKEAVARAVYTEFPVAAAPREQFGVIWRTLSQFALQHPEAWAFLELHHHQSYLDAESRAIENRLKDFGTGFVERAQQAGVLKVAPAALLMELVFGAFNGMMKAHGEGRLELTPAVLHLAEEACWDAIAARP